MKWTHISVMMLALVAFRSDLLSATTASSLGSQNSVFQSIGGAIGQRVQDARSGLDAARNLTTSVTVDFLNRTRTIVADRLSKAIEQCKNAITVPLNAIKQLIVVDRIISEPNWNYVRRPSDDLANLCCSNRSCSVKTGTVVMVKTNRITNRRLPKNTTENLKKAGADVIYVTGSLSDNTNVQRVTDKICQDSQGEVVMREVTSRTDYAIFKFLLVEYSVLARLNEWDSEFTTTKSDGTSEIVLKRMANVVRPMNYFYSDPLKGHLLELHKECNKSAVYLYYPTEQELSADSLKNDKLIEREIASCSLKLVNVSFPSLIHTKVRYVFGKLNSTVITIGMIVRANCTEDTSQQGQSETDPEITLVTKRAFALIVVDGDDKIVFKHIVYKLESDDDSHTHCEGYQRSDKSLCHSSDNTSEGPSQNNSEEGEQHESNGNSESQSQNGSEGNHEESNDNSQTESEGNHEESNSNSENGSEGNPEESNDNSQHEGNSQGDNQVN